MLTEDYIDYIRTVRRYSPRTQDIYASVLEGFCAFALDGSIKKASKNVIIIAPREVGVEDANDGDQLGE